MEFSIEPWNKFCVIQCFIGYLLFLSSSIHANEFGHPPVVLDLSQLHKRSSYTASDNRAAIQPLAIRTHNNNTSDVISLKVGGLGLASSTQNRINLGSISASSHKFSDALRQNPLDYFRQLPVQSTPAWPTKKEINQHEFSNVNMHVLGQPIDPRVVNHLHPDVTPFKARKLRKILAGSLDKEWTSELAPRVLRQRGVTRRSAEGHSAEPDTKLISEAHSLNFTFRHEIGNHFTLPEAQVKVFRNWLIDKATCEMDFIWEDLGPLFWPRWIRRGVCVNKPGHSCSWPPGMKCRPSGSRALQLLHWKCEDAAYLQSRKRAAEQRNRRRTTSNNFQSNFYDMKPVNPGMSESRAQLERRGLSSFSLRDTHEGPISLATASLNTRRLQRRSVKWDSMDAGREQKNGKLDLSREERRKRRARRLIKRLSVNSNGYHCYWQVQKYLISDRCACLCS